MSERINKIEVKNLFNKFHYEFDLKKDTRDVSILIGPNGCGKTTIFNILDFIFNPTNKRLAEIKDIPFDEFKCLLSNGKCFKLFRENKSASNKFPYDNYDLIFHIGDEPDESIIINDTTISFITLFNTNEEFLNKDWDYFDFKDYFRGKRRTYNKFYDSIIEVKYNDDNTELFRNLYDVEKDSFALLYKSTKQFYRTLLNSLENLSINYITSNRLFDIKNGSEAVESLPKIKDAIFNKFIEANKKYFAEQSLAKDNLVINYQKEKYHDFNEVEMKKCFKLWREYIIDVLKYKAVGLIDIPKELLKIFDQLDNEDDFYKTIIDKVMYVYIKTFKGTLEPIKVFYDKLDKFLNILNKRNVNSDKNFSFEKERGIILKVDGKEIPLDHMSSGEKNDFIMFYNLIFNSYKGGFVLIDEPEISFHIEWQESFLDQLIKICHMNELQAIIATHSPHILNNHFDLLIDYNKENA